MELETKLSSIIKDKRIAAGYTQNQVADLLGISRTTITKYETGEMLPSIKMLFEIDKFFNGEILKSLTNEGNDAHKNLIGSYIKAMRLEMAFSRTDLAKIIGVNQSTIARYELGQSIPHPHTFQKLQDVFYKNQTETNNHINVIRCKNCQWYNTQGYRRSTGRCLWHNNPMPSDGYCSFGEEASDETD